MNFTPSEKLTKRTRVLLFASYPMVQECLKLLLENSKNVTVVECTNNVLDLPDCVRSKKPDVILIYLPDQDFSTVEIIPSILEINSESRIVVLASNKDVTNQTRAVQLGASGIVQKEQNARMLTEAIRQVSEGETWINQKLLAQVLNNSASKNNSPKSQDAMNIESLTEREHEVIFMIARGLKNKDIAAKLFISEATVRHHLSSIYNKLELPDRLNLVIYAYQHGLIEFFIQQVKV
jgi:two-component system, NarL family, response regulator DegU